MEFWQFFDKFVQPLLAPAIMFQLGVSFLDGARVNAQIREYLAQTAFAPSGMRVSSEFREAFEKKVVVGAVHENVRRAVGWMLIAVAVLIALPALYR